MTVLTFTFLVCFFLANLVFVLVLLGAFVALALLSAALSVDSEVLTTLDAAEGLQTAGSPDAPATYTNGMSRLNLVLNLVLKLVKVRSLIYYLVDA